MNYNESQLINMEYELIENEILDALANDEREYFEYLNRNAHKAMILDLIALEMLRYNGEEIILNIKALLNNIEGIKSF